MIKGVNDVTMIADRKCRHGRITATSETNCAIFSLVMVGMTVLENVLLERFS